MAKRVVGGVQNTEPGSPESSPEKGQKEIGTLEIGKFWGSIRKDVISVRMIKNSLAVDTGRLRIVCACRNSEPGPEHPLRADHAVQRGAWTG